VELFGRSVFPPIGDLPYLLTLSGHGFYWFRLDVSSEPEPSARPLPELLTLVMVEGWSSPFDQHNRRLFEGEILPAYLPEQRWFAGKGRKIARTSVVGGVVQPGDPIGWPLTLVDVGFGDGDTQRYFLPLSLTWEEEGSERRNALLPATLSRARHGRREGAIYDATADPAFAPAVIKAMAEGQAHSGRGGSVVFESSAALLALSLPADLTARRIGGEQSNSTLLVDEFAVLKLYRRLAVGIQPEIEMARFLTDVARFPNTPPLLGAARFLAEGGEETALAVLFGYVRNQDSAWAQALNYLTRFIDEALLMMPRETRPTEPPTPEAAAHPLYLDLAAQLGQRTAELHRALCPAQPVDAAFAPEPTTAADLAAWAKRAAAQREAMFNGLAWRRDDLPAPAQELADRVLQQRALLEARFAGWLPGSTAALKTRYHGDYHLRQVLAVQNDFHIIDFEGEPMRALEERREKGSPLRDVAGMLRSYAYAAATVVRQMAEIQPAALPVLQTSAESWRRQVVDTFLASYRQAATNLPSIPEDPATVDALLRFFTLEKAVYEVGYELAQRPQWVAIPLAGVLALIEGEGERGPA
ncbi:MAG TPA: putative maltokinase, partial [Stellaceae bacterium]|nr:putative maltokinase [Stellaceae bacterium]